MKRMLLVAIVVTVGVVMLLHHHAQVGNAQSVHAVLANAPHLIGSDITVSGVAGNSLAVLGVGGFVIKGTDGSTLTVVSGEGVPLAGTPVTVHGVLRQAFASGTTQKLILVEEPAEPQESPKAP